MMSTCTCTCTGCTCTVYVCLCYEKKYVKCEQRKHSLDNRNKIELNLI